MITLMTFITCLAALIFLAVVAYALTHICTINENLGAIANGLTAVDSTLGGVHEALLKQEERS